MNCGALFHDQASLRGGATAIIEGSHTLTYAALEARTNRVANGLRALGLRPGTHLAVLIGNDRRFVEAVFGGLRAGLVVTPVTTRAAHATLHHVVADCGATALIASAPFAQAGRRLFRERDSLRHLILIDPPEEDRIAEEIDYQTWVDGADATVAVAPVEPSHPALLCYTSGSTGLPKGAMLTHGGVSWCADTMRRAMLLGPEQRCLLAVPLFHANATTCGLWPMLSCGGSLVIEPQFDAKAVLHSLSQRGCSYTTGVPAMYRLMLRETETLAALSFPDLEFVLCSSSEVPEDLLRDFETRFGVPMIEGYGLTEGGPMVLSNPRWGPRRAGTSGMPLPGVDVRVAARDDPSTMMPDGSVGELHVRSPGVTPGYHNQPEISAARLLPGGWLRTHDLVRRDPDGYIKVMGRVDDMIICGGENVYPVEVENLLNAHHDIDDSAVVAREDGIKGAVPVAFVVLKAGASRTAEEIKAYSLEQGPAWAHPREVYVLDALPLTAAKKIDKTVLRERARDPS